MKVGFRRGLRHIEETPDLSKAEVPPTAQMHHPAKLWREYVDGLSQRVVQISLHGYFFRQRLRVRYALYRRKLLFSAFPLQRREAHLVSAVPLAYLIDAAIMGDPKQPPAHSRICLEIEPGQREI